jgi:hypothetical protein
MTMRGGVGQCGMILAMVATLSSCLPTVEERQVRTAYSHGKPTIRQEQKKVVVSSAELESESIKVLVREGQECRKITETPMMEDSGTERTLSRGTLAQVSNLALSGLLLAVGIAGYTSAASGSCSKNIRETPTPTNPDPVNRERPCTTEEKNQQTSDRQGVSALIAGSAVIPLGAFVWNLGRAKDSINTTPLPSGVESTTWYMCGERSPAVGVPVEVMLGGVKKQAKTNEFGEVVFPLKDFSGGNDAPEEASVVTLPQEQEKITSSVSLLKTHFYAEWDHKRQLQERERQAAAAEMAARVNSIRKSRERETKILQDSKRQTVKALDTWVRESFPFKFQQNSSSRETCFNRVNTQVPCDSAAAFKKQSELIVTNKVTITNKAKFKIKCTKPGVPVDEILPGKIHSLGTVPISFNEADPRLGALLLGIVLPSTDIEAAFMLKFTCAAPVGDIRKAAGVSLESLEELGKLTPGEFINFTVVKKEQDTIFFNIGGLIYHWNGNDFQVSTVQ